MGSVRFSDTKAGGSVDCNAFSNTTSSACSPNGYNGGKVWTGRRWLARSAMVSVAVEKIGGLFFQPMDKTSGNAIRDSWPGLVGNTTPGFGMSLMLVLTR